MQKIDQEPGHTLFEVILYFDNASWLFSTFAKAPQAEDALEQAEDEIFIHSALHDIGALKASSAYVFSEFDDRHFSKRNGKWQTASAAENNFQAAHSSI